MGRPKRKNRITHTRAYKDDVADFRRELPGIDSADVIRMAWTQYNAVQKAGRFIYGKNLWKIPKKK